MSKASNNSGNVDGVVVDDGEPKENDKLQSGDNNGSGVNNVELGEKLPSSNKNRSRYEVLETRFQRAKQQIMENRYHRIILILLLLIFIMFLLVIILSVRLASIDIPEVWDTCESSSCLQAAASIVAGLNTSINPCTDFWSYACSGWVAKHTIPENKGIWSVRDIMDNKINHELRHYIDLIPQEVSERSAEYKVRKFYKVCLDVQDIEYSSKRQIFYDINEIGGWGLLSTWSVSSWDRNKVIEILQVKYGVHPYFRVIVGPDDFDPSQNIIKILPDGLGLPGKQFYFEPKYQKQVLAYKNFMRDLAKQFDAQTLQANQFAENTFGYEKRLAEITPDLEEYQDPLQMYKKRYTVRELMALAPSIKWLNILQALFPVGNVRESTRVLVAFESYFKNVSHIISSTDNTALNDYLMWRFTSTYVPYMTKAFRVIGNEFHQTMEGINSGSELRMTEDRWEFCIRLTNRLLGHALGAIYVKHNYAKVVDHSTKAQIVIEKLKSSLFANLDSFVWIRSPESKELIKQKLNQMQISIGHPSFIVKDDELTKYYNELIVQNQFFQNIIQAVHFINRKMENELKARTVSDRSWPLSAQDIRIDYQYPGNRLTVPAGILQPPIFDTTLPTAIKLGGLGFHVTSQLLKAFDVVGLQYSRTDNRLDPHSISGEAKEILHERLECLYSDLQDQLADQERLQTMNPNTTFSQTYIDIGALQFAFDAYQAIVGNIGVEGTLPGLKRSNDQLFFISFAQSMCEAVRPQKASNLADYRTTLPAAVRVNTILRQSRQFSSAFHCDSSSQMRSADFCYLW